MIKLLLFRKDPQLFHGLQDGTGHAGIRMTDLLLQTCFGGEVSGENTVSWNS